MRTKPTFGKSDGWLVCLDAIGQTLGDYAFGGATDEWPNALQATTDGGSILAGGSSSEPDGNKTSPHLGAQDFWLIKLRPYAGESAPVRLVRPELVGTNFCFWFQTQSDLSYTVEYNDHLRATNWLYHHTMTGDNSLMPCLVERTNTSPRFFRVRQP